MGDSLKEKIAQAPKKRAESIIRHGARVSRRGLELCSLPGCAVRTSLINPRYCVLKNSVPAPGITHQCPLDPTSIQKWLGEWSWEGMRMGGKLRLCAVTGGELALHRSSFRKTSAGSVRQCRAVPPKPGVHLRHRGHFPKRVSWAPTPKPGRS